MTERTVCTAPSAMSTVITYIRRPPESRNIAPGWPLTSARRIVRHARAMAAQAGSSRATWSRPKIGRGHAGLVPPPSPYDDDVGGEQLDQAVHVAVLDGVEEPLGEPLALRAATPRTAAAARRRAGGRARRAGGSCPRVLSTIAATSS